MSIKPEELKPCPFCGKEPDISDGDSLYPTGTGWKDDGECRSYHKGSEVPKEQWCYAAGCSELSGGCGAEMPGDSRQEAIDKWNTRAIPDTHRVVPVKPAPEMINAALPHAMRESDEDKYRAIGMIICIWDEMLAAHTATASQTEKCAGTGSVYAIPDTHRVVSVELLEKCVGQLLYGAKAHQCLNDEVGNPSRIAPGRIACETLSDELSAIIEDKP